MAGEERSERATPKRRAKLRGEGRFARSSEVNHTVVLIATLAALTFDAPRLLSACETIVQGGLARTSDPASVAESSGLGGLALGSLEAFGSAVWPVVATAALAGVCASVGQVGLHFYGKPLQPSFAKLNVVHGLKRMFGKNQLVELAKSIVKVLIIGTVAGLALWSHMSTFGQLVDASPSMMLSDIGTMVRSMGFEIGGALLVVAAADFIWQRRRFEKSIRMSKDEVKREARESDLAPELRGQIRKKQLEVSRRRMLADVPSADVVIVNPTHYAVALRYDGTRPAPVVVAKGVDHLALTIRSIAEEAGVTIVHQPPLARALYRDVDLGAMIPEDFFHAVAEVLAFVFRTARRRRRVA